MLVVTIGVGAFAVDSLTQTFLLRPHAATRSHLYFGHTIQYLGCDEVRVGAGVGNGEQ